MIKRLTLAALAGLMAVIGLTAPASAATYTRPVTLTATSTCLDAQWTVTLTATSTMRDRLVDLRQTGDGGDRPALNLVGVPQLGVQLRAGVPLQIVTRPGSGMYVEEQVFAAGASLSADPLVEKRVTDPILLWDPYSGLPRPTC